MMRGFNALWLLISLLISSIGLAAAPVVLIAPHQHYRIVHRIENDLQRIHAPALDFIWVEPNQISQLSFLKKTLPDSTLIITLGRQAFSAALQADLPTPVIATLLYHKDYDAILAQYHHLNLSQKSLSGIFLDQPFWRILALTKTLVPNYQDRVGMLLSRKSALTVPTIHQYAEQFKVNVHTMPITEPSNVAMAINQLLNDNTVLLLMPDHKVLNPRSARGLLLSAYEKKVPVIGYSKSLVTLGALAAVYITPTQVANQITQTIEQYLNDPSSPLPKHSYAQYFSVSINHHVAQSLYIRTPSESSIEKSILSQEIEFKASTP